MVVDGCKIGDPSFCQTKVDMTQVDSPSSTMHQCTTKFWIDTKIWKVMVDGIPGYPLSKSNVINPKSDGYTTPRVASKAFHYVGNVLSTSRVGMAIGDWVKLPMIL